MRWRQGAQLLLQLLAEDISGEFALLLRTAFCRRHRQETSDGLGKRNRFHWPWPLGHCQAHTGQRMSPTMILAEHKRDVVARIDFRGGLNFKDREVRLAALGIDAPRCLVLPIDGMGAGPTVLVEIRRSILERHASP